MSESDDKKLAQAVDEYIEQAFSDENVRIALGAALVFAILRQLAPYIFIFIIIMIIITFV